MVEIENPFSFIGNYQGFLTQGILCGDACRAKASITNLCLNTANREHKSPGTITPVSTQSKCNSHIKGANNFS